jgi:tRNA pseudouridine38-40 synthase
VRIRLRIDLAYAGGAYSGWAVQPRLITVQETLETALATALRIERSLVRTVVAGRTDAGVHALGQVCHLDLPEGVDLSASALSTIGKRAQGALRGAPIRIHSITRAPEGFDARFSPLSRTYEYRIADTTSVKNPLHSAFTLETNHSLDDREMARLGTSLLGLRDFATFCRLRPGATTIRELQEYRWERDDSGVLVATIRADAFCHSMVRALVGAAVAVGRGKLTHDEVLVLLHKKERTSAFVTMPARGLSLREVAYPDAREMGERAALTRNRRSADPD